MSRIKYNWLALIDFYDCSKEFDNYFKKHLDISVNRCARAFCLKKGFYLWSVFREDFSIKNPILFERVCNVDLEFDK